MKDSRNEMFSNGLRMIFFTPSSISTSGAYAGTTRTAPSRDPRRSAMISLAARGTEPTSGPWGKTTWSNAGTFPDGP
jgi:hypothetical protein